MILSRVRKIVNKICELCYMGYPQYFFGIFQPLAKPHCLLAIFSMPFMEMYFSAGRKNFNSANSLSVFTYWAGSSPSDKKPCQAKFLKLRPPGGPMNTSRQRIKRLPSAHSSSRVLNKSFNSDGQGMLSPENVRKISPRRRSRVDVSNSSDVTRQPGCWDLSKVKHWSSISGFPVHFSCFSYFNLNSSVVS